MKGKIFTIILCLCLSIFISGCTSEEEPMTNTNKTESNIEENIIVPPENEYAKDDVVNKFIKEYNDISPYSINNISEGNIRTKFFGYSNDCYLEMINANDAYAEVFSLSINGGKEEKWYDKILEVYKYSVKVLDPTITNERIEEFINEVKKSNYRIIDYQLTDTIKVSFYSIVELSYGKTDCRIDIEASDFK